MSHNILLGIFSTAEASQLKTIDLPITALYSTSTLLHFIENLNVHPKNHHLEPNYMHLLCGRGLTLYEGADIVDKLLGLWRMEMEVTPRLLLEAIPESGSRPAVSRALVEAYNALRGDQIIIVSQVQVPPTLPPRQQSVPRRSSPLSSSDPLHLPYTPPDEVGAGELESEPSEELTMRLLSQELSSLEVASRLGPETESCWAVRVDEKCLSRQGNGDGAGR